ncbi:MAG TPA: diguanylate cyclase [Candidatus Polarisedimenticolia bacterium]|nr:diguanylate cyclase [Candidatus Polarisedimenticolia bacterium]
MDQIDHLLSALQAVPGWGWAAGGLAALLLGWVLGRLTRKTRAAPRRPDVSLSGLRDLKSSLARLESENAALNHFFQLLPDFTKEINSRMERRAVGPLIMKITERLFAPTQVLLFEMDDRVEKLFLAHQRGLGEDVDLRFQVGLGEGRVGWVAEHRVAMEVNDFIREMRLAGASLDVPAHSRFRTELCAPLVYDDRVLGVISVGGITRHYKYEKVMLTLIADLGSIALHNYRLFTQVQEMANSDGLTKLFNKRFFLARLSEEILKAEKGHYPVSLFLFDLDNFKHYNDTQGHQAGDEVLKITGQIVRDMVRPDDTPARYGGEEFVVILPQTPKDGGLIAAERIRERVAGHPYPNREQQPLKVVSLSGGVATFPDDGRSGSELIEAADTALYRAKKAGRNRVYRSEPKYFSDESADVYYNTGQG